MVVSFDSFTKPSDSTILWKYIPFPEFVTLLRTRKLYLNALRNMKDPNEGLAKFVPLLKLPNGKVINIQDFNPKGLSFHDGAGGRLDYSDLRNCMFINSWTMSDKRNLLLWERYSGITGVAIKSSFKKLREAFQNDTMHDVHIGIVQYRDEIPISVTPVEEQTTGKGDPITMLKIELNFFEIIFNKLLAYSEESELRIVRGDKALGARFAPGIEVSVDIYSLIDEIYLHPITGHWHYDTVEDLLKKYSLDKPVSKLNS